MCPRVLAVCRRAVGSVVRHLIDSRFIFGNARLMRKGPLVILVADDDENDTLLLERAFKKVGVEMPVRVCRDGAEAMEYLKGEGKYADRTEYPFPRVLVTDLKMPKCTGFDLLQWLQNHGWRQKPPEPI